jgi:hypothetical protein
MEYVIAYQDNEDRTSQFVTAVASAICIRHPDMKEQRATKEKQGEEFENAKVAADKTFYKKNYKHYVDLFLMYRDYYARMSQWPTWDFVML